MKLCAVLLLIGGCLQCSGQTTQSSQNEPTDSRAANDPSAPITQVQLQDWYHPVYAGNTGQGNDLFIRPVLPFQSKGLLPSSIVRLAVDVASTPNGRSGLGDLQLIALGFPGWHEGMKVKAGVGPVIVGPSATNRYAGQGQWQVGPSALVIYSGFPKLLAGAIADNPITVTGERSRPGVNELTLEPLVVLTLPRAYFLRFDPYFQFDWKQHGTATLPINLGMGRVVNVGSKILSLYIQPEVLARRERPLQRGEPKFTLRFVSNILLPKRR